MRGVKKREKRLGRKSWGDWRRRKSSKESGVGEKETADKEKKSGRGVGIERAGEMIGERARERSYRGVF